MLQFFFFFLVNFLSFYFKSTFVFLISSRATVVAVAAFLDAFQKVADLATNSRGRKFQCVAGSSILHQTYCSSLTRQTALLTGLKLLRHCLTVCVLLLVRHCVCVALLCFCHMGSKSLSTLFEALLQAFVLHLYPPLLCFVQQTPTYTPLRLHLDSVVACFYSVCL